MFDEHKELSSLLLESQTKEANIKNLCRQVAWLVVRRLDSSIVPVDV